MSKAIVPPIKRICIVCSTEFMGTKKRNTCSPHCHSILKTHTQSHTGLKFDPHQLIKRCRKCDRILPLVAFSKRGNGFQIYCKECNAAYKQENKEHYREWMRQWRENNRDKRRATEQNRHAKKVGSERQHTHEDIQRQYKAQKGRCYWCNEKVDKTFQVDHVIPLSKGGGNGPENLVISCQHCNFSKHDKLPHEWHGSGGKLL